MIFLECIGSRASLSAKYLSSRLIIADNQTAIFLCYRQKKDKISLIFDTSVQLLCNYDGPKPKLRCIC